MAYNVAMPAFKIHRMKEHAYQHFRWAPHTTGAAQVKPRDYEPAGQVEAPSVYAAWAELRETSNALRVGDLLEHGDGTLRICKYVGFEEASWLIPEVKPVPEGAMLGSGGAPVGETAPAV